MQLPFKNYTRAEIHKQWSQIGFKMVCGVPEIL